MILVTGGAGFISANFVLDWLRQSDEAVLNVDKLTYAGNLGTLKSLRDSSKHVFAQVDICDGPAIEALLAKHKPRAVVHFAAESHVDRSIHGPAEFVRTNVVGTFTPLEAARNAWQITLICDARTNITSQRNVGALGYLCQCRAFAGAIGHRDFEGRRENQSPNARRRVRLLSRRPREPSHSRNLRRLTMRQEFSADFRT